MVTFLVGILGILVGVWIQQQRERHDRKMAVFQLKTEEMKRLANKVEEISDSYISAKVAVDLLAGHKAANTDGVEAHTAYADQTFSAFSEATKTLERNHIALSETLMEDRKEVYKQVRMAFDELFAARKEGRMVDNEKHRLIAKSVRSLYDSLHNELTDFIEGDGFLQRKWNRWFKKKG